MNKFFLTMSILSASLSASVFCAQEASADPLSRYKDGELQPARWHKMVPQIRIENRTPIVRYDTPPEPEPVYLIPTGLPQAKSAPVVVLPGPGPAGGSGGGIVAPPGFALVDPNHPSPARFVSNIAINGINPSANLPNGNTTNRLAGKMWGAPRSASFATVAHPRAIAAGDAAAKTSLYTPQSAGGGSGGASSTVTTAVKATLTKRFELLTK